MLSSTGMANVDGNLLQIRCPSCGQNFRVKSEVRGKMVECGACEARFRVDDKAILRTRKFYPGERKTASLEQFSRIPHANLTLPERIQTAQYAPVTAQSIVQPTSIARVTLGFCGAAILCIALLLLIAGARHGGALDGITTENRVLLGCFASAIGCTLLIIANPMARLRAAIFSLMGAALVIGAPFYYHEASEPIVSKTSTNPSDYAKPAPVVNNDRKKILEDLRYAVGYSPMEQAIIKSGVDTRIQGLWLKGISESNTTVVREYLLRISGASAESHIYPRLSGNYLFVLIDSQVSLEDLAQHCKRIGKVEQTVPELNLVEVLTENGRFSERTLDMLSDRSSPQFYRNNLLELDALDLKRINAALLRLSTAQPNQLRADILAKILSLLPEADYELLENISKVLQVWTDSSSTAPLAVATFAQSFFEKNAMLPRDTVRYLLTWKQQNVYPILHELWKKEHIKWEDLYMDADTAVQHHLIPELRDKNKQLQVSAARILARVGDQTAATALSEVLKNHPEPELQTIFQNAIESIEYRLKQN